MTDSPLDLSPLDPARDRSAFDARVAAIVREAVHVAPGRDSTPLAMLAAWTRPALAAAAALVALALPSLIRQRPQPARAISTAEILGVPRPLIESATSSTPPGVVDLVDALNADAPHGR
jgi:hypothetical protein